MIVASALETIFAYNTLVVLAGTMLLGIAAGITGTFLLLRGRALAGAVIGLVLILPLNGIETGTTNFQTFTEATFAFSLSPALLMKATLFAVLLGLFGGALPAWRAARMLPTEALRRQ